MVTTLKGRRSPAYESAVVDVGTTRLYREVRGSGPPVLLISGGVGDAGDWATVAPALAEEFTVVTYDRRGFSRSPRPDGWNATSVTEHAADAAALMRAMDLAPAVVIGHSSGASIACELVARQPEVVRHAVMYEPPLLTVVPNGAEIVAGYRAALERGMGEGGPRRAMELFMRGNAGDEVFESLDPAVRERMLDNGAVFIQIEMPAFVRFVPDRERLGASGVPLTVVVGEQNRGTWFGAAARWLAAGTGAELVELPGGHAGFDSHPREFVAAIRRIIR